MKIRGGERLPVLGNGTRTSQKSQSNQPDAHTTLAGQSNDRDALTLTQGFKTLYPDFPYKVPDNLTQGGFDQLCKVAEEEKGNAAHFKASYPGVENVPEYMSSTTFDTWAGQQDKGSKPKAASLPPNQAKKAKHEAKTKRKQELKAKKAIAKTRPAPISTVQEQNIASRTRSARAAGAPNGIVDAPPPPPQPIAGKAGKPSKKQPFTAEQSRANALKQQFPHVKGVPDTLDKAGFKDLKKQLSAQGGQNNPISLE